MDVVNLRRKPLRVLVVDDEQRVRDLLAEELPEMGFEVRVASRAEQALRMVEQSPPHIVVLDLNLPVMDGLELLDRLRESHGDIAVVILTGYGTLTAAQRAIRHRVVDFLIKPCHLGDIEAAMDRARRQVIDTALARPQEADEYELPAAAANGPGGVRPLLEVQREAIVAALRQTRGNHAAAARLLGISRRTLYNHLSAINQRSDEAGDL